MNNRDLVRQRVAVAKENPTSSAVHVDTIMGNESTSPRRKKKRKKTGLVEAIESLEKAKNVPTDKELYARVKAEAKRKFDVYPSAYANAWLVREYKSRGGTYKIEKASFGSRSEAGRYAAEQRWKNNSKKTTAKKPAPKKSVPKNVDTKSKLEGKAKALSEEDFKALRNKGVNKLFTFSGAKIEEIQTATDIYQGGGYQEINGYLRGKSKGARAKKDALAMQKAFNASAVPLPSDSIVYRGVTLDSPLEVGQVFTDKGFMSTSTKQSIGKRFTKMTGSGRASKPKVFMKIVIPKGTKVLASDPKENEVILNSKSTFRVVSAKKGTAGVLEYTLELTGK